MSNETPAENLPLARKLYPIAAVLMVESSRGQLGGASWPQSIITRRVSEGSIPRLRVGL